MTLRRQGLKRDWSVLAFISMQLAPPVVPGLKEEAAQSWILANREMEGKWGQMARPI